MGRTVGAKNKKENSRPIVSTLSPQERIQFLSNLIIDKILEDQRNGQPLLRKITNK